MCREVYGDGSGVSEAGARLKRQTERGREKREEQGGTQGGE